ncbi:hypothetical protein C0995_002677, partial [Termitomyces sp. Mi166
AVCDAHTEDPFFLYSNLALLPAVKILKSHEKVSRFAMVGKVAMLKGNMVLMKKDVIALRAENNVLKKQLRKLANSMAEERSNNEKELTKLKQEIKELKKNMKEWPAVLLKEEDECIASESNPDDKVDEETKLVMELPMLIVMFS